MDLDLSIDTKNIGHLGIITSLFQEYKIIDIIDSLLPKESNNQNVTHGEIILAMVMQGLGFSNQRLYLTSEFFSHVAMENLFKPGVKPEHFNASTISRTLDAIYNYGSRRFFMDVASKIIMGKGLLSKLIYIDTTSISVTGKKYKNKGRIELKQGYSKDYRLDLKQLVFLLATTDEGIPLLAEGHSGNASDGEIFQNAIIKIQETFNDLSPDSIFVLDSALYSKKFLLNESISSDWITRVPESIKSCREILEVEYPKDRWTKINKDYKYISLKSKHGGKHQRWLIVDNRKSRFKEIKTFENRLDKEEETIKKGIKKLEGQVFHTKQEVNKEIDLFRKRHAYFKFEHHIIAKKRRHRRCTKWFKIGFRTLIKFERNDERINTHEQKKGKFVLATNCTSDERITAEEILSAYRSRNNNVEGCFKFIKDRRVNLHQVFLKKETRIEAMLMVMSIILLVNNLAQLTLRDFLVENNECLPDQRGRASSRPTFQWAAYLMRHITKVTVSIGARIYDEIRGIKTAQDTIVRAFGASAIATYNLG